MLLAFSLWRLNIFSYVFHILIYARHAKMCVYQFRHQGIYSLAGQVGLEPTTFGFGDQRSANWNY